MPRSARECMAQSIPQRAPHEHAQLVQVDPIGARSAGGTNGVIAPGGRVTHYLKSTVNEIGQPQGSVRPPGEEQQHPLPG